MKKIFTILSFCTLAVGYVSAQSIDFAERAQSILFYDGSNSITYDRSAYSNMVQGASNVKFQISETKNTYFYVPVMAGYPASGIEVYPDKGWDLSYFYKGDPLQPYMGLRPTRSSNDNYLGFPALEVGDVVKVVSLTDPTLVAGGTTVEGSGVSADKAISYQYGGKKRDVNAREYTYTVTVAGKLCLNFAQNNMIYSINVQEPVETVKVDLDFYAQVRSLITEGDGNKYSLPNDGSECVADEKFKKADESENNNFYTINHEGFDADGISVWPNKEFQLVNAISTTSGAVTTYKIGLNPSRSASNNKVGIKNLKSGDVVVIRSVSAPIVYTAEIGSGSSVSETFSFVYGDKNRNFDINKYTYTVTSDGKMAWEFAQNNTIISINVSRTDMLTKPVAKLYHVSISGNWASFCAAEDVELPEGVYAYVGNVVSTAGEGDDVLTINKVESNKIPANEGVLLYSETDGDYELTSTTDAPAIEHNIFTGTVARTANPNTSTTYSLYDNEGTIEFWNYTGNYIPANKAYLSYSAPAGAPKKLRVQVAPKMPTAIDEVQTTKAQSTKRFENGQLVIIRDGVKYNVQGQIVK